MRHVIKYFVVLIRFLFLPKCPQDKKSFLVTGKRRVYHHHLMKTGGTSINNAFLNIANEEKLTTTNYFILMQDLGLTKCFGGYRFSAWNQVAIMLGYFDYAWSHRPLSKLYLPADTFVFCCIRNPIDRIYSRYKHLLKDKNSQNKMTSKQQAWLGSSFQEYVNNLPDHELCHQLYMFDTSLDLEKAISLAKRKIHFILHLECFEDDFELLSQKLGVNLTIMHRRKEIGKVNHRDVLIESRLFEKELEFYEQMLELRNSLNR